MSEYKYELKVTEEQYNSIIYALELTSRLESGQLRELIGFNSPIWNLTNSGIKGILSPNHEELSQKVRELKKIIGLRDGESVGVAQSTKRAKKLYEMYYQMKHINAKNPSVYKYKLNRLTDKPLIKIRKISDEQ